MSHRKLDYLNQRRIIYRRYPLDDKPTEVYDWGWYYEHGTHQCYELFRSKAKITTYKSLKWHLLVLWYLNVNIKENKFINLCEFIAHVPNNFTTFTMPAKVLANMINEIKLIDLEEPPRNKLRKVIFKDGTGLATVEKLKIVGSLIGRSKMLSEDDIYDCMIHINEMNQKITISKISKLLKCSSRTVYRTIGDELKIEKDLLNEKIQC
tara:strand:+ start:302 stop:925 length:624 start_codon:yes stop_codon:yes gene_type:complete